MTKTYSEHPTGLECGDGTEGEDERYIHGEKEKLEKKGNKWSWKNKEMSYIKEGISEKKENKWTYKDSMKEIKWETKINEHYQNI